METIRENIENYMRELKAWLNETENAPLEEMDAFFTQRVGTYEEHMLSHWSEDYVRLAASLPSDTERILDLGCGTGLELDETFRRFPDLPELYIYGADACTELGRIDEALELLDQGLSLDSEMYDAKYAKAHCLEALGNYSGACKVWTSLAAELEAAGFQFEAEEPRKLAEACRAKL